MSSAGKSSGTQSPPLEATGEHRFMGTASVDGGKQAPAVADSEQRQGYTQELDTDLQTKEATTRQPHPQKLGHSLNEDK